jgi:hypothetical protein
MSKIKQSKKQRESEKEKLKSQEEMKKNEDLDWQKGEKQINTAKLEKEAEKERKRIEKLQLKKQEEEETAAIAGANKQSKKPFKTSLDDAIQQFGASGIDEALELLSSSSKTGLERHPERRVRSAYKEFEEQEMEILKNQGTKLRQSQIKQLIQKKWKKSPLNPMNQASVAYNATKEEVQQAKEELELKKNEKFLMK